jgi:hypothetical protein
MNAVDNRLRVWSGWLNSLTPQLPRDVANIVASYVPPYAETEVFDVRAKQFLYDHSGSNPARSRWCGIVPMSCVREQYYDAFIRMCKDRRQRYKWYPGGEANAPPLNIVLCGVFPPLTNDKLKSIAKLSNVCVQFVKDDDQEISRFAVCGHQWHFAQGRECALWKERMTEPW